MKKTFLNMFAICVFSTAAFAGGSDSPGFTCVDGGSDSPGVKICKPVGGRPAAQTDVPVTEGLGVPVFIKILIAEYLPAVFLLN